jgi:hypothetical protein
MVEPKKKEKPLSTMEFEKEKLELIKLRIKNKYYERSDVLEEVASAILKKDLPSHQSTS